MSEYRDHGVDFKNPHRIIKNKIKCNYCMETIESKHRHDFVYCKCGTVAVDGGKDYLKRTYKKGQNDYTELSETSND